MDMGVASAAADERCSDELWSIDRESLKKVLWESAATISDTFPLGNISDALLDAVLRQCRKRLKAHKDRVYYVGTVAASVRQYHSDVRYLAPAYRQARTFQRGRRTCKQMASRFFREERSCNVRPQ